MTWDFTNGHTMPVVPAAQHIDSLGHTNNAAYIGWCEQVAWSHSESLGLSLADYQRLDRAMVIRRAEYDYLLPTLIGQSLTLATWLVSSDGRLMMERQFQLIRDQDQATVLRGSWQLVCVELSSGRARRLPEEFCQGYLGALVTTSAPAQ